ncbi:zinc finger BED domain-containing protein RICESLEEPER 2-like [Senna tora]|uniref:Zinc finger BED domain-containing protein RICESLEEPER 2-like n=1 Tax=Senna tora TaxID=362788 RepID=A0A834SCS9_9FABA|nr:zinc finger BED domain-containing protein RICESLEEPER 2-like [Senna tora]
MADDEDLTTQIAILSAIQESRDEEERVAEEERQSTSQESTSVPASLPTPTPISTPSTHGSNTADTLTSSQIAPPSEEGATQFAGEVKLSTITVDNCSANNGMINLIVDKLGSHRILRGRIIHMRCCAHILNLIVKDGLSIIDKAIETIRDRVAYWIATPSRYIMNELLQEYQANHNTSESSSHISASASTSALNLDGDKGIDEKSGMANLVQFLHSSSSSSTVKYELDRYFEEANLPWSLDFDILNWWKINGITYPTLQVIARDFLVIPVSTMASE